jgi:hypothetical protein
MKTPFLRFGTLLFLLTAPLLGGFRPGGYLKPVSAKTAAALSSYFRKELKPLKAAQIETLDAPAFGTWLRQSSLTESQKTTIRQYLQPVLTSGSFRALIVRNARPLQGSGLRSIAIIQVPTDLKPSVQGSSYVSIFADQGAGGDAPPIDSCQYIDCYCSSPGSAGSCVTATQFNKNCPPNECAAAGGTCDCGGGGGTNLDDVFQTLNG